LTGELLNRCGYWFFPHRVRLPASVVPGQPAEWGVDWENRGVAPAYHEYLLAACLEREGKKVFSWQVPSGNRRWLPGAQEPYREKYSMPLPPELAPGRYALKLKLTWPEGPRDVLLPLAAKIKDDENYYRVGEVVVEGKP
jgi:hypothetical protein